MSTTTGARPLAAPLALCAVVLALTAGACSGASQPVVAPLSSAPPSGAPAAASTPADSAGVRLLNHAESVMAGTTSYAFVADTTIVAASRVTTHLVGRVVSGQGLAYTLTVRSRQTQVVRLLRATYVRIVPQRWARLRHPLELANPASTLLAVLRAMNPTRSVPASHGAHTIFGTLGAAGLHVAGMPAGADTAAVVVTVDRAGHVTALAVSTHLTAGGTKVTVEVQTTYGSFGKVAPIRKPV
jgi:hypothetical protein